MGDTYHICRENGLVHETRVCIVLHMCRVTWINVYKVKIFNPTIKHDVVVRQLHHFSGKFACVQHVKEILVREYKSEIPDNMTNLGHFEGHSHTKEWIATHEDLTAMCARFSPGNEKFFVVHGYRGRRGAITSTWCET